MGTGRQTRRVGERGRLLSRRSVGQAPGQNAGRRRLVVVSSPYDVRCAGQEPILRAAFQQPPMTRCRLQIRIALLDRGEWSIAGCMLPSPPRSLRCTPARRPAAAGRRRRCRNPGTGRRSRNRRPLPGAAAHVRSKDGAGSNRALYRRWCWSCSWYPAMQK